MSPPLPPDAPGADASESGERATLPVDGSADTLPGRGPPGEVLLSPGHTLGRYRLTERLGAGGMGVVFAAYDPQLERTVALKVLRPGAIAAEETARELLLREARTMAQLSHRNVVAVYDAGTVGEHVFLAMEHIRGTTLQQWLEQQVRPWREVLTHFRFAGRGLAAAHAAGLVHRDFKPGNVLVEEGGRVLVTDFGLARTDTPVRAAPGALPPETVDSSAATLGLAGTPAYMSPEQALGARADARSDQFSFCVALYEALYGELPFPGDNLAQRARAALEGEVRPPVRERRVPRAVRRVLLRGLAARPQERFASMEGLLSALERVAFPTRRRGAWALALPLAAALAVWLSGRPARLCHAQAAQVEAVWGAQARTQLREALLGSGRPEAPGSWERVQERLEGWTQQWREGWAEACEATHVARTQPEATLVLRQQCLTEAAEELSLLLSTLATPEGETVGEAVRAAWRLPLLGTCAHAPTLLLRASAPLSPQGEAQRRQVRRELLATRALRSAGRYQAALERATPLAERAASVGDGSLEAEVRGLLGQLQEDTGRYPEAAASLRRAALLAATHGNAVVEAQAWTRLATVLALHLERLPEAHLVVEVAAAAVERTGPLSTWLRGGVHEARSVLHTVEGNTPARVAALREALALYEASLGELHPRTSSVLGLLANALQDAESHAEAREVAERALRVQERLQGPEHVDLAVTLYALASAALSQGDLPRAREVATRGLALRERALGPHSPQAVTFLNLLAMVEARQGRLAEATAWVERALSIVERSRGPTHTHVAVLHNNLAELALARLAPQQALAHARAATAIASQPDAPARRHLAILLSVLGSAWREAGDCRQATVHWQRLLELTGVAAPSPGTRLRALTGLGACALEAGHPARARPLLERALALPPEEDDVNPDAAEARLLLARTLTALGTDAERARALVREAREALSTLPPSPARTRLEAQAANLLSPWERGG